MAIKTGFSPTSEAAILSRLIRPEEDTLTVDAAECLLRIRFDRSDLDRMHELATKNQEGLLTKSEQAEMENYRHVSFLWDLMHSKARRSLKKHQASH
jgi:uncharacterized protein YnzC (UPF0291/DUF896 family)